MSEAGAGQHLGGPQRKWSLRHLLRDAPERHLPQPGMEVAGYRMETRLGTGGQGTVFI